MKTLLIVSGGVEAAAAVKRAKAAPTVARKRKA